MSKLLRLKRYVTLPEAVRHLTTLFNEPVEVADLLHLALDGRFTLSAYFVNGVYARPMKEVPRDEVKVITLPSLDLKGHIEIREGVELSSGRHLIDDGPKTWIQDTFDLPFIGGDRMSVLNEYLSLTNQPIEESVYLDGTFVRSIGSDQLYQLQDIIDPKASNDEKAYYPIGSLPDDAMFCIRTSELLNLERQLADKPLANATDALGLRERTSMMNIIGALLELVQSPRSGRDSDAAVIRELVAGYGDMPGISKSGLETKFAEAKRSLRQQ